MGDVISLAGHRREQCAARVTMAILESVKTAIATEEDLDGRSLADLMVSLSTGVAIAAGYTPDEICVMVRNGADAIESLTPEQRRERAEEFARIAEKGTT